MSESEQTTLELIHMAAKSEFLEKGFQSASLRNIVKTAGVTTGAFYGYFSSKAALFRFNCRALRCHCNGEIYDCADRFCCASEGRTAGAYGKGVCGLHKLDT